MTRWAAITAFYFALVGVGGCSSAPVAIKPAPYAEGLAVPLRPMEPSEDYKLGAPDRIELQIFELEKPGSITKLELEVSAEGNIMVPYVGAIKARGRTIYDLKAAIEKGLSRVLVDPQVTIFVKDYRSHEIAVMGAVEKAGVFYLTRNRVTLVEALSLAGGLAKESSVAIGAGTRVVIFPPRIAPAIDETIGMSSSPAPIEIDLVQLLYRGDTSLDVWVEPGAVINVPPAEEFFVQGYVNKAGGYPYRRPTTALQAISLAGGFDEHRASRSCIRVKRPTRLGFELLEVDGNAVASGDEPDPPVYAGDTIDVGRTVGWALYSELTEGLKGLFGIGFTAGALP